MDAATVTEEQVVARIERLPISAWYARVISTVASAHFFDAFELSNHRIRPARARRPMACNTRGNRLADFGWIRWPIDRGFGVRLDGGTFWTVEGSAI